MIEHSYSNMQFSQYSYLERGQCGKYQMPLREEYYIIVSVCVS